MDVAAHLAGRARQVEAALDRLVPPADASPARLHEALRYSLEAGGKRLRPALVMDGCVAVGGSPEAVLPTACALECVHTYSLIHDDLPCMDDDDLRRGRPSCHKQFDEATALLAGDALLTLAFELVARNADEPGIDAARALAASRELAVQAGAAGMVGGQALDLQSEGQTPTAELVAAIHTGKTVALITAAVVCGALLGGAHAEQVASLRRYARGLGLAFQIADDILDVVSDEATLGKPVGSDADHAKATWPVLFGLDESRRQAAALVDEAVAALNDFGPAADPLRALARYVIERDH